MKAGTNAKVNFEAAAVVHPKAGKEPPVLGLEILKSIPAWFVASGALVYVTGFLTVSEYQDSYGIRAIDTTLVQPRYAYIGFLTLLIPLSIGAITFAAYQSLTTLNVKSTGERLLRLFAVANVFLSALILVSFMLFAPVSEFIRERHWLPILGTMFLFPLTSDLNDPDGVIWRLFRLDFGEGKAQPEARKKESDERGFTRRAICFGIVTSIANIIVLTYFLWWVLYPWGNELLNKRFLLFLGAVVSPSIVGGLLIRRTQRSKLPRQFKWPMLGGIILLLYCFAVLAFGYGLYHWVSAGKGGGDQSDVGYVKLHIKEDAPEELRELMKLDLSLIATSDSSLFLADATNPAGQSDDPRKKWRWGREFRPDQIIEVRREYINRVDHLKKPTNPAP